MNFGEIKKLNNHRLMCGDATNKECINQLINNDNIDLLLTDPPYNLNIVKNNKVGAKGLAKPRMYKKILNDDIDFNPQNLLDLNCPSIIFGANNFCNKLPINYKWLVWFKKPKLDSKFNGFSDCELMWTNLDGTAIKCYHHTWSGMIRKGNRKLELKERIHPTQKPVGLLIDIIEDYTNKGDVVLDLYGGSGSTLIACEETGRKCLMMELDGEYCDIILKRYYDYKND